MTPNTTINVVENDGATPYRVVQPERLSYFFKAAPAWDYLNSLPTTDGAALEAFDATTFTWEYLGGKERNYDKPIRKIQEV